MTLSGITYYNDFVDINSVNNPLVGSGVQMQYKGFFYKNWTRSGIKFENVGYGLEKTVNDQGFIYCDDSSNLFSMSSGYVGMLVSFPYSFVDGVYQPLINANQTLDEHILWGVNIGQYQNAQPGFYAALTPRGIEFTIWTSRAKATLSDIYTTENANTDIFFEFMWDMSQIDDYLIRATLKVNEVYTAIGNIPIKDDNIKGLSFCALNTPFSYSNLECTIKKLIIYNRAITDDFQSSSYSSESSSSYSESTGSSLSTSSSTSYVKNWSSSSSSKTSQSGTSTSESSSSSSSFDYSESSSSSSSLGSSISSSSITISDSSESSSSISSESSSSSSSISSTSSSSLSSSSSSSSSNVTSSSSSSSISSTSSSSSCPNCNNCQPKLNYNYSVAIDGFTGNCSTFNGTWTISYRGTLICDWTYIIDIDHMIILWWDDASSKWYVLLTNDPSGTSVCGVTTVGGSDPCPPIGPIGNYTGGEGTVIVS